ncbi:MAG TPA: hypothetical protein ENO22_00875 [candidate division Zixibacteria bacterium]|nr:hypothetical protein [candidate division Zixibacteria bacterium]
MSYYLIRIGEGAKYIKEARAKQFIAIGWGEVMDLGKLDNLDRIKDALSKTSYEYNTTQTAIQAGQIYRFGKEMTPGDKVLSPLGKGEYLVGDVGEYYFEENPLGDCPYKHRRRVKWLENTLKKEDMSTNLSYALGAILTICSLDKYADELDALIAGETYTPAEKPQKIRDIILEGLKQLDGKEFEIFIRHVLEIIGFTAETTPYVSDRGIDVNGTLDAEGLASVTLRVQVKRVSSSIGNKHVLALRGALGQGEHGCLITISSFTSSALEEAEAPGKVLIKLIDGNDLAGIILKHFDEVDEPYRQRFGIRRKKDFNIEEQFEPIDSGSQEVDQKGETVSQDQAGFDTLICPAKSDGFRNAFIEQKAWWAVRLSAKHIKDIKYIAMYQVAPISAITHYAEVDRIEPYKNTQKYIIHIKGDPRELRPQVILGDNIYLVPQAPRYAILKDILNAKTLGDVFNKK